MNVLIIIYFTELNICITGHIMLPSANFCANCNMYLVRIIITGGLILDDMEQHIVSYGVPLTVSFFDNFFRSLKCVCNYKIILIVESAWHNYSKRVLPPLLNTDMLITEQQFSNCFCKSIHSKAGLACMGRRGGNRPAFMKI